MNYIFAATHSPFHCACYILENGRWMTPNMSFNDMLAAEKSLPEQVRYVGLASELSIEQRDGATFIEKNGDNRIRCGEYDGQIYELTDDALAAAEALWVNRAGIPA